MMLLITPKCRVWTGVVQTATLLSHEQFHYDVAIVIARVLARKLNSLRASSDAASYTCATIAEHASQPP